MEEVDFSKEIQMILSNDNLSDEIKSKEEIEILLEKKFYNNDIQFNQNEWRKHIPINKLLMGFNVSGGCFVFSSSKFCVSSGIKKRTKVFDIRDFDKVKVVRGGLFSDNIELDGTVIGKFNRRSIDHYNRIHSEINSIFKSYSNDSLVEGKKKLKLNKEGDRKDELSLSDKLLDFYNLNYYKESIRDWNETFKHKLGSKKYFLKYKIINNGFDTETDHTSIHNQENFLFSIDKDKVFYYEKFLLCKSKNDSLTYFKIDYSDINNTVVDLIPFKFGSEETLNKYLKHKKIEKSSLSKPFYKFLKNGVESIEMELSYKEIFIQLDSIIRKHTNGLILKEEEDKRQKLKEKRERLEEEKKLRDQQKHIENLERKKILQEGITKFIKEFDSDKDGIIDFNQGGDDFMNLLKKHQKTIIQVNQNHITKLVQVSNYLKTKRGNIQTQFDKIKNSRNSKQLNEFTGILKNQIDTFNLLNYNSLIMIISLVEGDLITFNEIYLTFDKLNIFNSNWENQVSDNLNNIDSKLDEVIYSINKMELSIVNEILGMSIMNQVQMNRLNKNVKEGNMMIDENLSRLNSSLSSNLKSIDSTLKVGNLISTINTYQNYKTNRRLNS